METLLWVVIIAAIVVAALYYMRQRGASSARSLEDSQAEARRWVERLGGQVYSLDPKDDPAARQALADAAERFTAAGSQVEQAKSVQQYRLAPADRLRGPVLRPRRAGRRSASTRARPAGRSPASSRPARSARTAGSTSRATSTRRRRSPAPNTQHYYPGGMVAGRPVPRGWYSEPWWKPALVAGAWGVGTLPGRVDAVQRHGGDGRAGGYEAGYDAGQADGGDGGRRWRRRWRRRRRW